MPESMETFAGSVGDIRIVMGASTYGHAAGRVP